MLSIEYELKLCLSLLEWRRNLEVVSYYCARAADDAGHSPECAGSGRTFSLLILRFGKRQDRYEVF